MGGLKCPNLQWYYWAAQLRSIMFYFTTEVSPAWLELESCSVSVKLPLHLYMYSAGLKHLRKKTDNPIVLNMINVWHDIQKYMGITNSLSCFTPIWGNVNFSPGTSDAGFRLWATKGLRKIQDLYKKEVLMSFEELSIKYDIPRNHFFKYLQLRSYISAAQRHSLSKTKRSSLGVAIKGNGQEKGLISFWYDFLVSGSGESSGKNVMFGVRTSLRKIGERLVLRHKHLIQI